MNRMYLHQSRFGPIQRLTQSERFNQWKTDIMQIQPENWSIFLYFNHHCHQPRHNGSSDRRGRAKAAEVNGQNWEDRAVGGGEGEWGGGIQEYRWKQVPAGYCLPPQTPALLARLQTDLSSDHRPCHNCPMAFNPSLPVSEKLSAAPFLGHPSCPQAAANLEPVLMGELRG